MFSKVVNALSSLSPVPKPYSYQVSRSHDGVDEWVGELDGGVPAIGCVQAPSGVAIVGRVRLNNAVVPAHVVAGNFHAAQYVLQGKEESSSSYEVLVAQGEAHYWQKVVAGQQIPYNAVPGGHDEDGTALFIGAVGAVVGKVRPSAGVCCYPAVGEERRAHDYLVLCRRGVPLPRPAPSAPSPPQVQWVPSADGSLPTHGTVEVCTRRGKTYVGRVHMGGSTYLAGVDPKRRAAAFYHGGKPHSAASYEVLVVPPGMNVSWVKYEGGLPDGAVPGGWHEGHTLHVGQVDGVVGHIRTATRACYYAANGKNETRYFQVLCLGPRNADPVAVHPPQPAYPQAFLPGYPQPNSVQWVPEADGRVPASGAVVVNTSRGQYWVGRVRASAGVLPAKVEPKNSRAYYALAGQEVESNTYEVLVMPGGTAWEEWTGVPPPHAVPGGSDPDGEQLFIGLADGVVGKVRPSHKTCYYPWGGQEVASQQFQVLCAPRPANPYTQQHPPIQQNPYPAYPAVPPPFPQAQPSRAYHQGLQWVPDAGGRLPLGSLEVGSKGHFVARVQVDNAVMPGTLEPKNRCAYYSHRNRESGVEKYEVLVVGTGVHLRWARYNGHIPPDAVEGCTDVDGTKLYIGRVGGVVGRVVPKEKRCFYASDRKEKSAMYFLILCATYGV